MDKAIKVILFDLGNVLIDVDYGAAVKRIMHFCRKQDQDLVGTLMRSEITGFFEEGRFSAQEFFLKLKELIGLEISYERFVPIWNEIFFLSAKNRFVYSIANSLRQNYKIAILSNINILHYDYISTHFPIFSIFDEVFVSFKMGAIKPQPVIYRKATEALGVMPDEIFYTDDREDLVKSAEALGIKSFLFTGVDKLRRDLEGLGVLLS